MTIRYVKGDATAPIRTPAVIAHVCNNMGAWGAGFTHAIDKRWTEPGRRYGIKARHFLGTTEFFTVASTPDGRPFLWVANMVAQWGINRGPIRDRRVDDKALSTCLHDVSQYAAKRNATVHMPRVGCGLGGAKWDGDVEPIVREACAIVDVWVYDP